jgi:hypothetical protein
MGQDNDLRKLAEEKLKQALESNPKQLLKEYMAVILGS